MKGTEEQESFFVVVDITRKVSRNIDLSFSQLSEKAEIKGRVSDKWTFSLKQCRQGRVWKEKGATSSNHRKNLKLRRERGRTEMGSDEEEEEEHGGKSCHLQ